MTSGSAWRSLLPAADTLPSTPGDAASTDPAGQAPPVKGPPLPFLSVEGYSGGVITPMAYLCNPGPKDSFCSWPTAAFTFLNLGSKELHTFSITEVFFNRVELGYAFNYFSVGSLDDDISKAGLRLTRDDIYLHHFNARVNVIPEDSFDLPVPAVTLGVHFKYNDGIKNINNGLGRALSTIGYEDDSGEDYTMTMTKMFPKLAFGRPVIVTGGLRFSNAAQLGLLGFGGGHNLTPEASVACLPLDNLVLAYEFRGKNNPYTKIRGLLGNEDNWQAVSATWIASNRLTISGVFGLLGNIANAHEDSAFAVQVKYEF